MEMTQGTKHKWKVFGRTTKGPTFVLADVPFKMKPVQKDVKILVERLDMEEIIDLFGKFCDMEIIPAVCFGRIVKAYILRCWRRRPMMQGKQRPGIGSDGLVDSQQTEHRATHHCPACFMDWPLLWDPTMERKCVCVGRRW